MPTPPLNLSLDSLIRIFRSSRRRMVASNTQISRLSDFLARLDAGRRFRKIRQSQIQHERLMD